jgi:AAA ATPase domain
MARFFNTAGPCRPEKHYMLPAEARLPDVARLVGREQYFVVHAPRQTGKTTAFAALARRLTAEGSYTALLTSCEAGQSLEPDLEGSIDAVLDTLRQNAEQVLPAELRPPAADPSLSPRTRLRDLLVRWARQSPRPLAVFFDEFDSLFDEALISVLRQLRSGYDHRPRGFPQSVALIGLRDVRDYLILAKEEDTGPRAGRVGSSSPFNVKVRSYLLRNFTAEEVAELYRQHTDETGQAWTAAAMAKGFELTGGQPWLVNALAEQIIDIDLHDRSVAIDAGHVERARETLVLRRETHLDSLVKRLREPRVRGVIEPIVAGEALAADVLDDDVQFVFDLGLIRDDKKGLEIANPIYREIVPRALTANLERSIALPRRSYLSADGGLDFDRLLEDFRAFWLEHAESYLERAPYSEAAAHLVFQAYLQKVVNAGGYIDREYAAGRGRLDVCVRWPLPDGAVQRFAVELKVWRDTSRIDPVEQGKEQLAGYLARLGLDRGTLLVFDNRSDAQPLPDRMSQEEVEHDGRQLRILML